VQSKPFENFKNHPLLFLSCASGSATNDEQHPTSTRLKSKQRT